MKKEKFNFDFNKFREFFGSETVLENCMKNVEEFFGYTDNIFKDFHKEENK